MASSSSRRLVHQISVEQAQRFLLHHMLLVRDDAALLPSDASGIRALLSRLGCVQIDPLLATGVPNHEQVFLTRLEVARRHVWEALNEHCFEHWAKERCLLPRDSFHMYYHRAQIDRGRSFMTDWWDSRISRNPVPQHVLDDVLAEVRSRGPLSAHALGKRGTVQLNSNWVAAKDLTSLALDHLWSSCRVVICGKDAKGHKLYRAADTGNFVINQAAATNSSSKSSKKAAKTKSTKKGAPCTASTSATFDAIPSSLPGTLKQHDRWSLLQRVDSVGLMSPLSGMPFSLSLSLSRTRADAAAAGPHWSTLDRLRKSDLLDELLDEGLLEQAQITGVPRTYLVPRGFAARLPHLETLEFDDRVRLLAPLDPLLWDRDLVERVFGFKYTWEVYKKPHQRQWGYYVTPMLYKGTLFGRIELVRRASQLDVPNLWLEPQHIGSTSKLPPIQALFAAIVRHAHAAELELLLTLPHLTELWERAKSSPTGAATTTTTTTTTTSSSSTSATKAKPVSKKAAPIRKRKRQEESSDDEEDASFSASSDEDDEAELSLSDDDDDDEDESSADDDDDTAYRPKRRRVAAPSSSGTRAPAAGVRRSSRLAPRSTTR